MEPMNLLSELDLNIILLLGSVVLLLLAGVAIHLLRRQNKQQQLTLAAVKNDLRALTTAAVSVGERLLEVERRQRRLAERQEQVDIYDSANQPYEHAIRMVEKGASVEQLVDVCGLSTNEAELLHMMHRFDKAG
ncbi:DUF2802 domain-containing protein [Thiohalophilus sp.]|uniref:DUF2802 domain-containing protein n=1 Tax=Thiohalophilus sp. TaxID=3028392 RepID=UPI002ACD71EE|nr:DUF2802 domain-containing protein [Thiohalophilus sp.]MDZ7804191.1 DUF2802 domain-containing protein [Thiohalophilus sp.]